MWSFLVLGSRTCTQAHNRKQNCAHYNVAKSSDAHQQSFLRKSRHNAEALPAA